MAKITLDLVEEYPFILYGISASVSDYRICWGLNKSLGMAFKREKSLEVYSKLKDLAEHGYFTYSDDFVQAKYRLIENKKGGSKFLPEVPQADFLLVVDDSPAVDANKLVEAIKSIRSVLMVFRIDIQTIKQKQNLLLTA